jgi:cytidine deaminase
LTEVEFDHDLSIRPCGVCLEAIDEALEEFETPEEENTYA